MTLTTDYSSTVRQNDSRNKNTSWKVKTRYWRFSDYDAHRVSKLLGYRTSIDSNNINLNTMDNKGRISTPCSFPRIKIIFGVNKHVLDLIE